MERGGKRDKGNCSGGDRRKERQAAREKGEKERLGGGGEEASGIRKNEGEGGSGDKIYGEEKN